MPGPDSELADERVLLERKEAYRKGVAACKQEVIFKFLQTCSNLGSFYQLSGRLEDAETHYKDALETIPPCIDGIDDAGNLLLASSIHTELGVVLRRQGKIDAMVASFETALEIRKKLAKSDPGAHDARLAEAWNNLGTALRKAGNADGAQQAFSAALAIREALVACGTPESHHDLANTHASLGSLLRERGMLAGARAAFEAALRAHDEIPADKVGPFLVTRGTLLNSIGVVKNDLKEFAGALESYHEALKVYEQVNDGKGMSHVPEMAMVFNNIGSTYKNMGQHEAAEQAFVKSYNLYKGLVQDEPHVYSRYLKVAMENLQLFYSETGKKEKGLLLVRDTLEFIQAVAGVVDEKLKDLKGMIDKQVKPRPARAAGKVGRNDPCPCGSGKKYKKCCLPKDQE